MNDRLGLGPGNRFLLTAACFVVVVSGLKLASSLLIPLMVAFFISVLAMPVLFFLKRYLPNGLAVTLTLAIVISLLAVVGFLVGGSVQSFAESAPRYQARLASTYARMIDWFAERGVVSDSVDMTDLVDPAVVIDYIRGTLVKTAAILSNLFLVLVTMVFVLLEAAGLPAKLSAAMGDSGGFERFSKMRYEIQRYLGIKTVISLVTGSIVAVWLALLGIDFALLWGLVAFLLNFIPNLGSIIAAVPATLLALVQFGPGRALLVALGYVVVNATLGNLLEPQLMGRKLGLSPLVIFISLIFWGWVWGPLGMILSVPLTMIMKIALENTEDLRWVAILLDAKPPPVARA